MTSLAFAFIIAAPATLLAVVVSKGIEATFDALERFVKMCAGMSN